MSNVQHLPKKTNTTPDDATEPDASLGSAAPSHPTADEAKRLSESASEETQNAINWQAFIERGAAALNFWRLCAAQRGAPDATDADFAGVLRMLQESDRMIGGEGAITAGFGKPVRVRMARDVASALLRVETLATALENAAKEASESAVKG